MKKIIIASVTASLMALSGCASNSGVDAQQAYSVLETGSKAWLRVSVNNRCQSELANNRVWQTAKVVLNSSQQSTIPSNVCGCVSSQAVNNVTADQLAIAAIDQNARNTIVVNAVANSLNTCYNQFMGKQAQSLLR